MRLNQASKLISLGMFVLCAICISTLLLAQHYFAKSHAATEMRFEAVQATSQLFASNLYLTQNARQFLATGDQRFREHYLSEYHTARSFQQGLKRLHALGLTPEEQELLASAEDVNETQARIELRAILQLEEADKNQSLANDDYIRTEPLIVDLLQQVQQVISARFNQQVDLAEQQAQFAMRIAQVVQGLTVLYILVVLQCFFRSFLIIPLSRLTEQTRQLLAGQSLVGFAYTAQTSEIGDLARALDSYRSANEGIRRQTWVKGCLAELSAALQSTKSLAQFNERLRSNLVQQLQCDSVQLRLNDAPPLLANVPASSGLLRHSLPLLQGGQQLASLDLSFATPTDTAREAFLDALAEPLTGLLAQLLGKLHNAELLDQARQQGQQLALQTDELRARQQIVQDTESWFRGIIEAAPDGMLVFDEEGYVILANRESGNIFGCRAEDLLTQHYSTLVPSNQREQIEDLRTQLIFEPALERRVQHRAEALAQRSDGSEFPIEVRLSRLPALGGRSQSRCAVVRDLSQVKQAELQLQQSHAEQQAIFAAAPYGIAFIRDGLIVQANLSLDELFRFETGEQLGCTSAHWSTNAELYQQRVAEIRQRLSCGEIYQQNLQLKRKDGSLFWASISGRAINPHDLSYGSIFIIEDISLQQAAVEEMRQARELAEAAGQMKSDFLANMSHEIRTPMNAIIGMTHLALSTELNARQRDYISKVLSSSQHLLGILNDILDLSKIEAGKLDVECSEFNLTELIGEVADLMRPRAEAKQLDLLFDIAHAVPQQLLGDPLRLRQILLNYLSNALKFTVHGQITVSVTLRERDGQSALLGFSVQDSGIGLDAAQCARLFQSFQQADASTTRRYGGTGLGLAIAKQLAELMGGEVGVQSQLGLGSTFWFTARVGICQVQTPVLRLAPAELPTLAVQGKRILLVEDNELNQQVAGEILQAAGCLVDIAGNGQIALDRLQTQVYDLVFMDMQMPVLDGLAATVQIRQQAHLADLPVIAMTANAMQQDRDRCRAVGMNDFISKPFEPATLYAVLRHWLQLPAQLPNSGHTDAAPCSLPEPLQGLQIDGLDLVAGLRRVLGKGELYLSLLRKYLVSQRSVLEVLPRALAAGDVAEIERQAHSCKGVSATVGAQAVQDAAGALETAAREGQSSELLGHALHGLTVQLRPLLEQLQAQLPIVAPPLPVVGDATQVLAVCRALIPLLADNDASAGDLFSANAGLLLPAFTDFGQSIDSAIADFEFEQALELLHAAMQRTGLAIAP